MVWNRENQRSAVPSAQQPDLLLRLLLILIAVKEVIGVLMVCVIGRSRLFLMLPRWAAVCVMAVAVLRLLTLVGIWRFNRFAVVLYLLLGFLGVATYAAVHSSVGNPLGSMGCAALLALISISRWQQFSWYRSGASAIGR
jgi:hypothetical protein